jgi:hypothetical protein
MNPDKVDSPHTTHLSVGSQQITQKGLSTLSEFFLGEPPFGNAASPTAGNPPAALVSPHATGSPINGSQGTVST